VVVERTISIDDGDFTELVEVAEPLVTYDDLTRVKSGEASPDGVLDDVES
jgi:hypothetical protein